MPMNIPKDKLSCKFRELWSLGGDDSWYVDSRTIDNWLIIYEFLAKKKREANSKSERNPKFSISEISKNTGISQMQVKWALILVCKRQKSGKPKYIRTIGIAYPKQNNVRISNKVELLSYIE